MFLYKIRFKSYQYAFQTIIIFHILHRILSFEILPIHQNNIEQSQDFAKWKSERYDRKPDLHFEPKTPWNFGLLTPYLHKRAQNFTPHKRRPAHHPSTFSQKNGAHIYSQQQQPYQQYERNKQASVFNLNPPHSGVTLPVLPQVPLSNVRMKTVQEIQKKNRDKMAKVSLLLDSLLDAYDSNVRPDFGGPPTEVFIDFHIRSMGPISEVDMSFVMDCYFRQTWTDHRLQYPNIANISFFNSNLQNLPDNDHLFNSSENQSINQIQQHGTDQKGLALSIYMLDKIWKPPTYFLNSRQSNLHMISLPNKFVRIFPNGSVLYSMRMTIKTNCQMNLENFPMDTQRCPLTLGSFGYTSRDLIYNWNPERKVVTNPDMKMSQFDLISVPVSSHNRTLQTSSPSEQNYSILVATFHFQRHMGSFVIEVYAPCIMLVVLSWVGFWINREATADRVTLGLTTVLTMTFLGLELRNDLPKVPYLTALDYFVYISFGFISATILEFGFVHFFTKIGSGEYYFSPFSEFALTQTVAESTSKENEHENGDDICSEHGHSQNEAHYNSHCHNNNNSAYCEQNYSNINNNNSSNNKHDNIYVCYDVNNHRCGNEYADDCVIHLNDNKDAFNFVTNSERRSSVPGFQTTASSNIAFDVRRPPPPSSSSSNVIDRTSFPVSSSQKAPGASSMQHNGSVNHGSFEPFSLHNTSSKYQCLKSPHRQEQSQNGNDRKLYENHNHNHTCQMQSNSRSNNVCEQSQQYLLKSKQNFNADDSLSYKHGVNHREMSQRKRLIDNPQMFHFDSNQSKSLENIQLNTFERRSSRPSLIDDIRRSTSFSRENHSPDSNIGINFVFATNTSTIGRFSYLRNSLRNRLRTSWRSRRPRQQANMNQEAHAITCIHRNLNNQLNYSTNLYHSDSNQRMFHNRSNNRNCNTSTVNNPTQRSSIRVQLNSVSQIDRTSRVIFPLAFLLMNFIYWLIYLPAESRAEKTANLAAPFISSST